MDAILNPKLYHEDFDLKGFHFFGGNVGIKDATPDFGVIFSEVPAVADAVFTQNRFPGAPIIVGKRHVRGGLQAVVVNSKNANVYTGKAGERNALTMCEWGAEALGIRTPGLLLPSSTGIIGQQLDMDKIRKGFENLSARMAPGREGLEAFAQAIMTSDAYPKWGAVRVGATTLVGVVKGAGMIEPNMATMLAYFLTDAAIPLPSLRKIFRRVVDNSFNAITVDGDTSTSDTAVILANGMSRTSGQAKRSVGGLFLKQFERALGDLAGYLAQLIVADGEGACKIIELHITHCRGRHLAEAVAKSVLNSPLVKTAIHGADPNWGRIIMAIGKVDRQWVFDADKVKIFSIFSKGRREGRREKILLNCQQASKSVTPNVSEKKIYEQLKRHFSQKKVELEIDMANGKFSKTFWGSDLGVEYVKYNSDYTS